MGKIMSVVDECLYTKLFLLCLCFYLGYCIIITTLIQNVCYSVRKENMCN